MVGSSPRCKLCGKNRDVEFSLMTPLIPPYGSACTACEDIVKTELASLPWGLLNKPTIDNDGNVMVDDKVLIRADYLKRIGGDDAD